MTEFKKISELDRINSLRDTDLFVVETLTGTKAITRSAFKDEANMPTKEDIGLSNVDNTSDLDKPISNATQSALDEKVGYSELNNYLTIATAEDTYLTKDEASGVYFSKDEFSQELGYFRDEISGEISNIRSQMNEDFLKVEDATNTYVTQDVFNEALADLEALLSEV